MAKLLRTICKGTNIFAVLLYLLACLIPFLPPGEFWPVAILGLVFPFIFFTVALFLIGWLLARSRWFILSLVALLLGWKQLSVVAALHPNAGFTLAKKSEALRVLSWNLSCWGQTSKKITRDVKYRPLMVDLVKKQEADVLCFQEFWDADGEGANSHDSILPLFRDAGYKYNFYVRSIINKRSIKTGVVILSKFPIIDTGKFTFGESDFAEHLIYVDIMYNNNKVRVYTTHLQSVRFDSKEYRSLDQIKRTNKKGLKDSKTIVSKLKNAYQLRDTEAELVRQKIKESPYPVIVCGDFNDVPNSYTYFTIKGNLQDAFLKKGCGFGRTFQYISPTLRIDYILADKNFEVKQFNRIIAPYSDHYPIITDLHFKNGLD